MNYFSQIVVAKKLSSVVAKLKKFKKDHNSLMVSSLLTQQKLERVSGELKEKSFLTVILRERAMARERGEGGQRRVPREVRKHRRYEICVRECCHGFARIVYDQVVECAKHNTSELCLDWKSVVCSWMKRNEIVGESEKKVRLW